MCVEGLIRNSLQGNQTKILGGKVEYPGCHGDLPLVMGQMLLVRYLAFTLYAL